MPQIIIEERGIEVRLIPGDARQPWLIFLHEGLGCVSLWKDFPDQLARRLGCRALIYSRFGYGLSAAIDGPRDADFMHAEALTILPKIRKKFAIEAPILIGHSDGASIALIHAAQTGNDVRATALIAPHVMVEPVTIESIARVTSAYRTSDLRQRLARYHAHVDDAFLGWSEIWLSTTFRNWNLHAEAARLNCPSLLIQGADDEYGTLAQLAAIEAVAHGPTQRLVLSNCGHAPHRDEPGAVLDAISGFVARLGDLDRVRAE
jgi:pimeloyl-ACP methyl ester carboxylesterase